MSRARRLFDEVRTFLKWTVILWFGLSWTFMIMAADTPQSPLYLPIEKELHYLFVVFPIISLLIVIVGRIIVYYSNRRA